MNKPTVEHPKIFISYAWSSKEYQEKVLSLASDLVNDGIDVLLDRWSLKEGNDTYAFMEQSVTDSSITNVLILLDPQYESKANNRSGGVGTETQIISPEIYNKVKQEKFLPIVFERDEKGGIPKPAYLQGLLHFDLSKEESYDEEYQRLVKRLYGIEIIKKPELGNKPAWLESKSLVSTKIRSTFSELKNNEPEKIKVMKFKIFLTDLKNKILFFKHGEKFDNIQYEDYISLYDDTRNIRDEFLELIQYTLYVDNGERLVADILEELYIELNRRSDIITEILETLLHELFIYMIAIYYKSMNYKALSYTLTKSYFINEYGEEARSFSLFYKYNQYFENAINKRDDKVYNSGAAQYWIENVNTSFCSKNDFVFADILCYNVSVFTKNELWYWFPITYNYAGHYLFRTFARKLQSKEHLNDAVILFGYSDLEKFIDAFIQVEKQLKSGVLNGYRHSGSFDNAPLLCQYIKSEELGTCK